MTMKHDPTSVKTTSFGDLPLEVQTMVAAYLSLEDLTICVLVCEAWHTLFNPQLWRHLENDEPNDWWGINLVLWGCIGYPTYALSHNSEHIQSMKLYFDYFDEDDRNYRHDAHWYKEFDQFLEDCPTSFPHLTSARLFGLCSRGDLVVDFLRRGSSAGWKELALGMYWDCDEDWTVKSAPEMVSAILGQASTLTVLRLDGGGYFRSKDLQQFLCSAPNLREFHLLGAGRSKEKPDHCLDAADVVLCEWICLDLEVFGCAIGGIPRPDITRTIEGHPASEYIIKGARDDSIDIQRRVYTQLARLTKLRELNLGSPIAGFESGDNGAEVALQRRNSSVRQFHCLAMSLQSGLDLLKGLKELRDVKLVDMEVYVDRDEEQAWISEHWPDASIET